jgi:hypothetical protein
MKISGQTRGFATHTPSAVPHVPVGHSQNWSGVQSELLLQTLHAVDAASGHARALFCMTLPTHDFGSAPALTAALATLRTQAACAAGFDVVQQSHSAAAVASAAATAARSAGSFPHFAKL